MNYELESYEGELRELREFKDKVDNMHVAYVWHEGSSSFYLAYIIAPLTKEEVMGNPYG